MYSFQPATDMTNTHVGFYIILMMAVVLVGAFMLLYLNREMRGGTASVLSLCVGLVLYTAYGESYGGKYIPPKNEQVVGEYVGVVAEGYRESSGKTKADHHYFYVTYRVPEGLVTIAAQPGSAFPQRAILYKN